MSPKSGFDVQRFVILVTSPAAGSLSGRFPRYSATLRRSRFVIPAAASRMRSFIMGPFISVSKMLSVGMALSAGSAGAPPSAEWQLAHLL
jgi:hypothetical protein